jgi:hypothetical protein
MLATYLPAFFIAGGLCLIASLLILTMTAEKKVAVPAATAA